MNTKTMRLPPRRVLTPAKRKEKDDYDLKPSTAPKLHKPAGSQAAGSEKAVVSQPPLLAGYLAYEFITQGTLFGQPYDPPPPESKKLKPADKRSESEPFLKEEIPKYIEVADLLKIDGTHIAGIVNPTQLARFLQM